MNPFISFTVFALAVSAVWSYSGGAPEEVCDDMTPKHPVEPKKSSFPFTVTVSQNELKAGEKLQVTINGGKEEKTFKGFFLQIRNGDKAVGSFVIDDSDKYTKTVNCHGSKQSAATHKNSIDKETLTVDWIPPPKFQGKLDVYATVAKDGEVFWVRQKQAEIKVN